MDPIISLKNRKIPWKLTLSFTQHYSADGFFFVCLLTISKFTSHSVSHSYKTGFFFLCLFFSIHIFASISSSSPHSRIHTIINFGERKKKRIFFYFSFIKILCSYVALHPLALLIRLFHFIYIFTQSSFLSVSLHSFSLRDVQ